MRLVTARLLALEALLTLAAAVPAAADVTTEPILAVRFADAPPAPAYIAVTRFTLPPGTAVDSGPTTGPRLFLVESGNLTVRSAASADTGFRRAADAPAAALPPGASPDVLLHAGEYHLPADPASRELRNDGTHAAAFLDAVVFSSAPVRTAPFTTAAGVIVDPLVAGIADALPATPIELRIERLDVATGEQVALAAAPGPRLLVVESGTLGLAATAGVITYSSAAGNNPGAVAGRVRTVAPGSEALLTARGSVFVQAGAVGTAGNLGRTRLVLLSLTLLPASQATTTDPAQSAGGVARGEAAVAVHGV
jgi:hypothetical protein